MKHYLIEISLMLSAVLFAGKLASEPVLASRTIASQPSATLNVPTGFYLGEWLIDDPDRVFLIQVLPGWYTLDKNGDAWIDETDVEIMHKMVVDGDATKDDLNEFLYCLSGWTSAYLTDYQGASSVGPQESAPIFNICILLGDLDLDGDRDPDFTPDQTPTDGDIEYRPSDYNQMLPHLFQQGGWNEGDLNFDGVVDVSDLNVIISLPSHGLKRTNEVIFPREGIPAFFGFPDPSPGIGIGSGSASRGRR